MGHLFGLFRNLFHRKGREHELDAELRAYLDLLVAENIAAGESPEVALRSARLQLGGMEQVKEQVRDAWFGRALDGFWQDLRHTVRNLRTNFTSTVIAALMLTLGIGATTLIFSVFYSVLLQPLPFAHPERLVEMWETRLQKGWTRASFSEANFWDVRARNHAFTEVAAAGLGNWNMTGAGDPEPVSIRLVTAGFFNVLGVRPVLGRTFSAGEDQPGRPNGVALLENKFWRTRFGASRQVIGQTVRLDGHPYTVIGVLPPGEPWLEDASIFVPLVFNAKASRGSFELSAIGRLRDGVSAAAAVADLRRVCSELDREFPKEDGGMGVVLAPAAQWSASPNIRIALRVLLSAVGFLLLIACVNLANLLLAKSTARAREMTIRAAVGASRGRIVRLVLTESMILSLAGAVLGLLLASGGLEVIKAAELTGIPRIQQVSLNVWVLAFTIAVSLATGVLSGLAPAWQVRGFQLATALREGDRSQTAGRFQTRLRSLLVAVEVALSLLLLVGAGLLIHSFSEMTRVDRGFATENRLLFAVNLPSSYTEQRTNATLNRYLTTIREMPGVVAAALVNTRPITGWDPGMGIDTPENAERHGTAIPWASWRFVSNGYFRTMGVRLRAGRVFTEEEEIAKPWRVVVSQSLAATLWPGQPPPVGRRVFLWKGQGNHLAEVIGVVDDMRERGLDTRPSPIVYLPYNGSAFSPADVVVHAVADPLKLVPGLRTRLAALDANLPLANVTTLDAVIDNSLGPKRLNMFLLGLFAAIALLLALTGIYGVLAYSVARRTAELSLRVVLGATRESILRLVLAQGMRPILIGLVVGLAAAFGLSRFIAALLFQVEPADPLTFAGVSLLVLVTAAAACLVPALRAARVDPAGALRRE